MTEVKLNVEQTINVPEIKDVITLMPVMDNLKNAIIDEIRCNIYEHLPEEDKDKYNKPYKGAAYIYDNHEQIYEILCKLGFTTTNGNTETPIPSIDLLYKKIVKLYCYK